MLPLCGWEWTQMQPLWTSARRLLNKLKLDLGYSPVSSLQGLRTKESLTETLAHPCSLLFFSQRQGNLATAGSLPVDDQIMKI